MSWAISATVGLAAVNMVDQYGQQSASASFNKKQSAYNDKQNAKKARIAGTAVDTNIVRARTEATATIEGIQSQTNEAMAAARVAQAASNVGAGSADSIINNFAKKSQQAEGSTIQMLVSELVGAKLDRQRIAMDATAGMSTQVGGGPSAFGALLGGATNFFQMSKGLSFGNSSTAGVSSASFQSVAPSPFGVAGSSKVGVNQFLS